LGIAREAEAQFVVGCGGRKQSEGENACSANCG
jgi:hypothetical protein